MTDIKIALRKEVADLVEQLQADPRYLKLEQARALLALYEGEAPAAAKAPFAPRTTVIVKPRQPRGDADRLRAMEIAEALLKGRVTPRKTSEIMAAIEADGIMIGGHSPVSNLSAMLSRSPKFRPHGRAGWTLTEMDVEPSEPAEDADRGEEMPTFLRVAGTHVHEEDPYAERS